jgi:hypothetical protein
MGWLCSLGVNTAPKWVKVERESTGIWRLWHAEVNFLCTGWQQRKWFVWYPRHLKPSLWLSYGSTWYSRLISAESDSYVTTDGQSTSLSSNKVPISGLGPDLYHCQTVAGFLMWGAISDERTGMSFATATGPRQRSHFWVRVPWSHDHILLSQIREFPFRRLLWFAGLRWRYSTPPLHGILESQSAMPWRINSRWTEYKTPPPTVPPLFSSVFVAAQTWTGRVDSYVTTDGQSASLSWNKHPSGAYDQIFITVR